MAVDRTFIEEENQVLMAEIDRLKVENSNLKEIVSPDAPIQTPREGVVDAADHLVAMMREGGSLLKEREDLAIENAKLLLVQAKQDEEEMEGLDHLLPILAEVDALRVEREQLCKERKELAGEDMEVEEGEPEFDALLQLLPLLSEEDALKAERQKLRAERRQMLGLLEDSGHEDAKQIEADLPVGAEDRELEMKLRVAVEGVAKENSSLQAEIEKLRNDNSRLRSGLGPAANLIPEISNAASGPAANRVERVSPPREAMLSPSLPELSLSRPTTSQAQARPAPPLLGTTVHEGDAPTPPPNMPTSCTAAVQTDPVDASEPAPPAAPPAPPSEPAAGAAEVAPEAAAVPPPAPEPSAVAPEPSAAGPEPPAAAPEPPAAAPELPAAAPEAAAVAPEPSAAAPEAAPPKPPQEDEPECNEITLKAAPPPAADSEEATQAPEPPPAPPSPDKTMTPKQAAAKARREALLQEAAALPLDPKALFRQLLSCQAPHPHNVDIPTAGEAGEMTLEEEMEQRKQAMAAVLRAQLEGAPLDEGALPGFAQEALSPKSGDQSAFVAEPLDETQEVCLKGALHTLFRSFAKE
eukprot:TRINITY_DN52376_c0_g1_i1.p1 TRINITY_DN52376_c0_g1~~TRINITY_DN52376_c0_g1_i1.p1  ORF type:complete len:594 (-),score=218.09 TRINITY_DN52376_c0_g1_i1:229-1974(-)